MRPLIVYLRDVRGGVLLALGARLGTARGLRRVLGGLGGGQGRGGGLVVLGVARVQEVQHRIHRHLKHKHRERENRLAGEVVLFDMCVVV